MARTSAGQKKTEKVKAGQFNRIQDANPFRGAWR